MSELLVAFSPAAMSRAADGLAAVGLWSKAYTHAGRYFEAYEAILPKLPTPSPLELAGQCRHKIPHQPVSSNGDPDSATPALFQMA